MAPDVFKAEAVLSMVLNLENCLNLISCSLSPHSHVTTTEVNNGKHDPNTPLILQAGDYVLVCPSNPTLPRTIARITAIFSQDAEGSEKINLMCHVQFML